MKIKQKEKNRNETTKNKLKEGKQWYIQNKRKKKLSKKRNIKNEKRNVLFLFISTNRERKKGGDKNIGSVGLGGELESNKWI